MSQPSFDPENLAKAIRQSNGPAPVHLWDPPFCGDIDMRIARDGSWHYQGSPIGRQAMVKLFSSVLRLDDDGHYYLVTPVEKLRIQVEDCPFVAQLLEVEGSGREQKLWFTSNTDEKVLADADHPITVSVDPQDQEPHPRLLWRSNLQALISRSVFYQLVEIAETRELDGRSVLGVWSGGSFFSLGSPDA